jgi:hypothetical protein
MTEVLLTDHGRHVIWVRAGLQQQNRILVAQFKVVAYGQLRSFSCRSLLELASPGNGGLDRPLARTVQKLMLVVFIDRHFTDFPPWGEGA